MVKSVFILGFLFSFVALPPASFAQATDVWVTQAGAGAKTGADLADAAAVTALASTGNCSPNGLNIGPGTVIHLAGNYSFPSGTNGGILLVCSGSSGAPITMEPYSPPITCTSANFGNGGGTYPAGCIDIHNLSYVHVTGLTNCGTSTGGVDLSTTCGIQIYNNALGTAYPLPSGNSQSILMDVGNCTPGCEVDGVLLGPVYARTPNWTLSSVTINSATTGQIVCSANCTVGVGNVLTIAGNPNVRNGAACVSANFGACVLFTVTSQVNSTTLDVSVAAGSASVTVGTASGGTAVDETTNVAGRNLQFYSAISGGTSSGFKFHDSIVHDCGWCITISGTAVQIYNNQIYYMDHGIAMTPLGSGGTGTAGPLIHDNHLHDMYVWDDTLTANENHHDGIHLLLDTVNTSNQDYYTSVYIYNNRLNGDPGTPNAWMFLRASTQNEAIFNNVFGCSPARSLNLTEMADSTESGSFTTNPLVANNTTTCYGYFAGGGAASGWTGASSAKGTSGIQEFNNIWQGQQTVFAPLGEYVAWAAGGIDYNIYENANADSGGTAHVLGVASSYYDTVSAIQGYFKSCTFSGDTPCAPMSGSQGQESHGQVVKNSALLLSSNGSPQTGSPALGAGVNLTSLCTDNLTPLCTDIAGNPRPSTGAWDIGAYYVSGGSTSDPPAAPAGLTAVVH